MYTNNNTSSYSVAPNQQRPQPASNGQFSQYPVEQGQAPYSQATAGFNPYMIPTWIPLNDRMVNIPAFMLQTMETNLTTKVQREQDNNMTVALSVLPSAIFCFLQFEKAFKTLFSKGDDNTQLHNLEKCINELKQANISQKEVSTHDLGWLVTREVPIITNTRELFEHCIKVIDEFIPCLGGRRVKTYTHEKTLQFAGWRGWQQQAEQIRVSNMALGRLLQKFLSQDPENASIYKEISCFQQSVEYTLDCFFLSKYPTQKSISAIYASNGFQFISEVKASYHDLEDINIEQEEEEGTTEGQSVGLLGSWFGGSQQ